MLVLVPALEPKVLTKAHFRNEFSILREVVVELSGLEILRASFQITNSKADMETSASALILRDFFPAEASDGPTIEGFRVERLSDDHCVALIFLDAHADCGSASINRGTAHG